MPLTTDQLQDIQTLLDNGAELTMWKTSNEAHESLVNKYGCAFFNPSFEDPPQSSDDAEYGFTVQSALERAIRRISEDFEEEIRDSFRAIEGGKQDEHI